MTLCQPAPTRDDGMVALIGEQLDVIRDALPGGVSFDDWYSNGEDVAEILGKEGESEPLFAENVHYALGFLRGVAAQRNQTVLEMLWDEAFDLTTPQHNDPPKISKARKPRKKGKARTK